MKLAFFSPFPPKQTGVAAYSQTLVKALRDNMSVTTFDHTNPVWTASDFDAVDFGAKPEVLAHLGDWDLPIFSLGNNPYYHAEILRTSFRTRGLLLLHDTVLYFLFAGLPAGAFYRHFCETYGLNRSAEIQGILQESPDRNPLRYPYPARYSFLAAAVKNSEGVIVHNQHAAALVRSAAPEVKIHLLPMISHVSARCAQRSRRAAELRARLIKTPGKFLFGSFGFLGSTKRFPAICAAFALLPKELDWHFVIVGEGPDPVPEFAAAGFGDRVTWLRYVSDDDYDGWIEASDLVLNLRYPSMGESSATLSRAMGMGKPCVVTRHGSFEEIPEDTVAKVPYDESESLRVAEVIVRLCGDRAAREALGSAAAHYTQVNHSPEQVALRMREIVQSVLDQRRHPSFSTVADANRAMRVGNYLQASVRAALPSHLQGAGIQGASELPPWRPLGLNAEQALWCFRVLLDRDPNPEHEIPQILRSASTLDELREIVMASDEFKAKQAAAAAANDKPILNP